MSRSRWGRQIPFHCVLFVVGIVLLARADTVKLKDGTEIEGNITSEDSTQVVVELQFAAGTISTKQIVRKTDVVQITRLTEEQKAQRAMERAFDQVQEYQLDANTSEPQSYYDHVINDVFRPFLRLYPNSPHEEEVNKKIAEWTAEREKVASGLSRIGNEWMPKAEAERRVDLARAQVLLNQGQALLVQSNFSLAMDQFKAVISLSKQPEPVDEAKRLYGEACRRWLDSLERQQQSLNDEIKLYEDRVARTLQKRNDAEGRLKAARRTTAEANANTNWPGEAALTAKMRADYEHAYAQHAEASNHLLGLRKQLASVEQITVEAQNRGAAYGPLPPSEPTPLPAPSVRPLSSQPAPSQSQSSPPPSNASSLPPPPPPPTALEQIGHLIRRSGVIIRRYWIVGVIVLLGGLWGVSRLTTRR